MFSRLAGEQIQVVMGMFCLLRKVLLGSETEQAAFRPNGLLPLTTWWSLISLGS